MKNILMILALASTFLGAQTYAQDLVCSAYVNSEFVFMNQITPENNAKVLIGREPNFTAYITQKDSHVYVLEAFIVNQETRIYSEGSITQPDSHIKLSLWSRDEIIDIDCTPAK